MFKFRFGEEKDFQTNMSYRCYLTETHFTWECPLCGIGYGQYHETDCPVERKENGEIFQKVSIADKPLQG